VIPALAIVGLVLIAVLLVHVTGGNLSASEIQNYAAAAGFTGDDLNTAVAIALAESSGDPHAIGDLQLTPGGSVGLWQINLKAHPEYSSQQLLDPQTNAVAAFAVYQQAGYSFSPWSTFNSGAYAAYLPAAGSSTPATVAADFSLTVSPAPDSTDDSEVNS
jgi:hypothetical protein